MIEVNFKIEIPTWDNGVWTETVYNDIDTFREFVFSTFKVPGEYDFDDTALLFNQQARNFDRDGIYCLHPKDSKEYTTYWNFEKKKSTKGVIFKNENKVWYLPRDWYFWINFLKIFDKVKKGYHFPIPMDVQLHISLYELLAELNFKHASVFKKRQIASSYFHAAKMINRFWFDEGAILKIGASLKNYINSMGTWKFLDEYRDFLNQNTAWFRPTNPGKVLNWEQRLETTTRQGVTFNVGLKSRFTGMSFEQSPTVGVGGPCSVFFYEEAGIAPEMDKTYVYIKSALQAGLLTTGLFIAAGSVGELKYAQTLKDFTLNPNANGIYSVKTDLIDDKGTVGETGLFIPEQWGMFPYVDKYGNSMVKEALAALDVYFADLKRTVQPDKYQLEISQRPRNIKEGFAFREESKFPQHLVSDNKQRILDKEYPYELLDLSEDSAGNIVVKKSNKTPINTHPVDPKLDDKSGCLVVWERPDPNATWGTYLGSVDPVSEGKTITSDSLCSIYIYKNPVEVSRKNDQGEIETFLEGDKIVATWCGRFDDINETHKRLELIIRWYKAWTIIENNISLFIQYMISKRLQRFMVPKNQILFLKEASANQNVFQEYGWRNVGVIFKNHLLSYLIEFLKEVIDEEVNENGEILKRFFGISRIPDLMAMVEMENYQDGVNVDRLVSLAALIAFVQIYKTNYVKHSRNEISSDEQENSVDSYKFSKKILKNIGTQSTVQGSKPRSAFKNIH